AICPVELMGDIEQFRDRLSLVVPHDERASPGREVQRLAVDLDAAGHLRQPLGNIPSPRSRRSRLRRGQRQESRDGERGSENAGETKGISHGLWPSIRAENGAQRLVALMRWNGGCPA